MTAYFMSRVGGGDPSDSVHEWSQEESQVDHNCRDDRSLSVFFSFIQYLIIIES